MFRIDEAIETAAREAGSLRAWAMAKGLPVSAVHDWARRGVVPSNLAVPLLAKALGLTDEELKAHIKALRGIPIDTPEQTRAVLAERGMEPA